MNPLKLSFHYARTITTETPNGKNKKGSHSADLVPVGLNFSPTKNNNITARLTTLKILADQWIQVVDFCFLFAGVSISVSIPNRSNFSLFSGPTDDGQVAALKALRPVHMSLWLTKCIERNKSGLAISISTQPPQATLNVSALILPVQCVNGRFPDACAFSDHRSQIKL